MRRKQERGVGVFVFCGVIQCPSEVQHDNIQAWSAVNELSPLKQEAEDHMAVQCDISLKYKKDGYGTVQMTLHYL